MRRIFLLSSVAVATGSVMVGCGGSSDAAPVGNTATRVVAGYVYVRQNTVPNTTPTVIVVPSSTAPSGYAAPTAGTVTLSVADGTITRDADSEVFNMASGNAIVANVTSISSGTPTCSLSFSGLQLSGENKVDGSSPSFSMAGTANTVLALTYNAPGAYTPGAPASMKVLIKDPSTLYGTDENFRFGAPSDIIGTTAGDAGLCASSSAGDQYDVAVLLYDANGVLIPGTTFSVADASPSGPTATAVSFASSKIAVAGGGVEGAQVDLTFSSPQAPGMTVNYTTQYSYGSSANYAAVFSAPSDPATLVWPVSGGANTAAIAGVLNNGRGIAVPNKSITWQVRDARATGSAVFSGGTYPSAAAGTILTSPSPTTDGAGNFSATFNTPTPAAGNSAFNSLNIKYADGVKVDVLAGSSINGTKKVTITRPLNSLTIAGVSRMDTGTTSPSSGSGQFRVTDAQDVDAQSVTIPTINSWTLNNVPADPDGAGPTLPFTAGNADDTSVRSQSNAGFSGAVGLTASITAGSNAGQFTVFATSGSVSSNTLTVDVYGVPAKMLVSPSPTSTGLTGTAGTGQTVTVSFSDSFGHTISGSELTYSTKTGTILSSGAGNINFPPLNNLTYVITPTASGTMTASMRVSGSWTGTAGGATQTFDITRNLDITTP